MEKFFCQCYARTLDTALAERAARRRYPGEALCPEETLGKRRAASYLKKLWASAPGPREAAAAALRRLALGCPKDACRLLREEEWENLDRLDLFCVSEIEKSGGKVQIRFADRLKACQMLLELAGRSDCAGEAREWMRALQAREDWSGEDGQQAKEDEAIAKTAAGPEMVDQHEPSREL